jgi:hypothetical protein
MMVAQSVPSFEGGWRRLCKGIDGESRKLQHANSRVSFCDGSIGKPMLGIRIWNWGGQIDDRGGNEFMNTVRAAIILLIDSQLSTSFGTHLQGLKKTGAKMNSVL